MKKVIFALALVAGLATAAQAQYRGDDRRSSDQRYDNRRGDDRRYDDRCDSPRERDYEQDVRIRQGAIRGDLTRQEVARLKRQQVEVDRAVRWAKRDGFINRRERVQIAQLQQQMDWAIVRERRDWDRSTGYGYDSRRPRPYAYPY